MERPGRLTTEDFTQVWRIMEESFPVDERRTREGQRGLLTDPRYRLYGIRREGEVAAFAAVWRFADFSFLEHLAVDRRFRSGGTGAALLEWICSLWREPVVLEVEPPEGELARRRIGFYERNGFSLNAYYYIQPALSAEGNPVPLLIMSRPGKLGGTAFVHVRETLYRYVYGTGEASDGAGHAGEAATAGDAAGRSSTDCDGILCL